MKRRDKRFICVTSRKYGNKIWTTYNYIKFYADHSVIYVPDCDPIEVKETGVELMGQLHEKPEGSPLSILLAGFLLGFMANAILKFYTL